MGDFNPLAHVNGLFGFSSIALICNKYSATCKPTSTFDSMTQKYVVQHEGQLLTFTQSEFDLFSLNKISISAAGGLVENDNGEFLFMSRLDHLDLPKGKLELGESESAGALREVEEETGVQGIILGPKIIDTYHTYEQKTQVYLKRTGWYKMKVSGCPKLTPQIEEGIVWVKWMNIEEVESRIAESYPSIRMIWNHVFDY